MSGLCWVCEKYGPPTTGRPCPNCGVHADDNSVCDCVNPDDPHVRCPLHGASVVPVVTDEMVDAAWAKLEDIERASSPVVLSVESVPSILADAREALRAALSSALAVAPVTRSESGEEDA